MTDRELALAGRHALRYLDDERELGSNRLFSRSARPMPYEELRAMVLAALESLAPIDAGEAASRKQRRLHDILVRCDLRGEPHKCVIDEMGLSRRQFYRERREALVGLAAAIDRSLKRTDAVPASIALGNPAEAVLDALRAAGQFAEVWREARTLATQARERTREIKFWIVASGAARCVGNMAAANEALDRARAAAVSGRDEAGSYERTLWVAIGEIGLHRARADCDAAAEAFDAVIRAGRDELTLQGDEARLFGIMLGYAAQLECDRGRWDRAQSLLARALRLAEHVEISTTRASLLRISGQVALRGRGDARRSIGDYQAALEADRRAGELGSMATSAVYYATTIGDRDAGVALPYAEYGLEIARRFSPGDRYVRLLLESIPLMLRARGAACAADALKGARRLRLDLRDSLFLDLAEAKVAAFAGDARSACERAEATAARLAQCGLHTWAADAQLVAAEAYARLGERTFARRRLAEIVEDLSSIRADVRDRAQRIGTLLALSS